LLGLLLEELGSSELGQVQIKVGDNGRVRGLDEVLINLTLRQSDLSKSLRPHLPRLKALHQSYEFQTAEGTSAKSVVNPSFKREGVEDLYDTGFDLSEGLDLLLGVTVATQREEV
jgi:hypothetical protein